MRRWHYCEKNETQLDGARERVILWILLLSELIKTIR